MTCDSVSRSVSRLAGIDIVRKGDDCIESVVAARELEHDQYRVAIGRLLVRGHCRPAQKSRHSRRQRKKRRGADDRLQETLDECGS